MRDQLPIKLKLVILRMVNFGHIKIVLVIQLLGTVDY
jgi:hypothetical protein